MSGFRKPGMVFDVELVAPNQVSSGTPELVDGEWRGPGCVWFDWPSLDLALGDQVVAVTVRVAGAGIKAELVLQHFGDLEPIAEAVTSIGDAAVEQLTLEAWPVVLRAGFWPRVIVTSSDPTHRVLGASARTIAGAGGDPQPN